MLNRFLSTTLLVLLLSACSPAKQVLLPTETSRPIIAPTFTELFTISTPEPEGTPTYPTTQVPSRTHTPVILADTFITGYAFLDQNANGFVDSEDAPIGQMKFMITLSQGTGFGDLTSDTDGCALVIVPGALPKESWPIVAQMEIPQTFTYIPVGDGKIILAYPDLRADFLFSQP